MIDPDIDAESVGWRQLSAVEIWEQLHRYCREEPLIVGVDGRSGAGKSTLAAQLAARHPPAALIHTDDVAWHHSFFDWADLLVTHLLAPLRGGHLPISFRPQTWERRGRPGAITIAAGTSAVIVEGVGATQHAVRPFLDAAVWVHIDNEVGLQRVRARGTDSDEFIADWARAENAFLAEQRPWEHAILWVAGDRGQANARRISDSVGISDQGSDQQP